MSHIPLSKLTNSHTVDLRPRGTIASRPANAGLKHRHHSPSYGVPHASSGQQVRSLARTYSGTQEQFPRYTSQQPISQQGLLVSCSIDSMLGHMVVRVLVFLLLFQPVYVAFGIELDEGVSGDTEASVSTLSQTDDESDTDSQFSTNTDAGEQVSDTDYSTSEPVTTIEESGGQVTDVQEGIEGEGSEEVSGSDTTETDTGADTTNAGVGDAGQGAENIDIDPTDDVTGEENGLEERATTTDSVDLGGSGAEEVQASTTEAVVETSEAEEAIVAYMSDDTNKYVFGEGDCTLISEGEFYCIAEGPKRERMTGDRRVYAEKDREGDREIFYFDGVEVHRVTNNSYDDFSPTFDEETMRIVWQAMINDRLQVMVHDIPTETTRQVTTSRNNSSNPNILGSLVVWQEWIDTNWEVMMTDVDTNGEAFVIERLTDNVVHDMFPALYDGMVTWQSERGASWEVVVYDLRTKKRHSLEKTEDTKFENPRFVLLFDSKHENGDVETIGYDLDSGEMMELGTKSHSVPLDPVTPKDEVPDAIAQTVSTSTSKVGREDMDPGDDPVIE